VADLARSAGTARPGSTSRGDARARPAPAAAEPAGTTSLLLSLQQAAGNGAVARLLQRSAVAPGGGTEADVAQRVPQAEDPEVPPGLQPSRLSELDDLLDRWNVPEDEVIDLLGEMGPSDKRAVLARYRDQLADCLDVGEMKRAVTNLGAPLRVALDWIDAAALVTRAIDYVEIQSLVTSASQPERDAVATNHYRDFFVKVCTNNTMIAALIDLRFPWSTARRWAREEGTDTVDLARALASAGVISVPGLTSFLRALERGADDARTHLRNLSDEALGDLRAHPATADVIRDRFGASASPILNVLNGEIASGQANVTTSEDLLAGEITGPFTSMHFGGENRFSVTYRRDRVTVSVGVELEAVDARARELLPAARAIWLGRIQAAWGNRFRLTNGQRTIPLRFQVNLDSGPNHVNVHSGVWAWPNLNAGNWFAPDHEQVPQQEEAVSQAPVHEFGHLIGNVDEYNRTAEHYVQVTQQPLTSHGTVPETDTAGVTRYTNSLSIMGSGRTVEPRHIDNILGWVNANLRTGEPSFTVVA
jgi:hypothetical protein